MSKTEAHYFDCIIMLYAFNHNERNTYIYIVFVSSKSVFSPIYSYMATNSWS